MKLGEKIKYLRKSKHLTLRDLSKLSHCSLGFLSQVERDLVSPTISSLRKISDALEINIISLFDEDNSSNGDSIIVKKGNRRTFSNRRSKVTYELLRPRYSETSLEALCVHMDPNSKSGDTPHSHNGEEFFLVVEGRLNLEVNGKKYNLSEGDSGMYKSNLPHRWENPSNSEKTTVIWVNSPPTF